MAKKEFEVVTVPVCANCGERIKTEHLYDLGKFGLWCEDCIDDSRRYNEER